MSGVTGIAKSFGLGRALGCRAELPNEERFVGDHQLNAIPDNYSGLTSSRPGALVVDRDEAAKITTTALFLGQAHERF